MVAAVEPGTGRVRALAVNRNYKLDDPQKPKNKPSTNPGKRKRGIKGTYPNTTNPLITGGGDITGYQAGSTFKIFTVVAALEKGYPLATTINATSPLKSNYIVEFGAPGRLPRAPTATARRTPTRLMNGVRNMWSGVRPLGQHVLRAAAGDGRRRQRRRRGEAAGHPVPRRRATPTIANDKRPAKQWGAFTLGVSGDDAAGAGQRVRDAGGRRHVLRADPGAGDPRPHRRQARRRPTRAASRPSTPEVARAAIDAARCPVGDQFATSRCDGGTATRRARRRRQAGRRQDRHHRRREDRVAGRRRPSSSRSPASSPTRTRRRPPDRMEHDIVNPAVYETLRDAHEGQTVGPVHPAQRASWSTATSAASRTSSASRSTRPARAICGRRVRRRASTSEPVDSPCPRRHGRGHRARAAAPSRAAS